MGTCSSAKKVLYITEDGTPLKPATIGRIRYREIVAQYSEVPRLQEILPPQSDILVRLNPASRIEVVGGGLNPQC